MFDDGLWHRPGAHPGLYSAQRPSPRGPKITPPRGRPPSPTRSVPPSPTRGGPPPLRVVDPLPYEENPDGLRVMGCTSGPFAPWPAGGSLSSGANQSVWRRSRLPRGGDRAITNGNPLFMELFSGS